MFDNEVLSELLIFNSWPSKTINRNESEFNIVSKYFDVIDKETVRKQMLEISKNVKEIKNKEEASTIRTKGNAMYKDKNYDLALKLYNKSIFYAPRDSNEFALAIANRSATFFDMEMYKECLQDTNIVLKSEYPENLRYKIYLCQSKCYLKLNMNFEVAKSLRRAEDCVVQFKTEKTNISLIKNAIIEIKNQLKEQSGTSVPVLPDDDHDNIKLTEPSLKNGNNPKFLNAAQVVDFKYTKKLGRHVIANADIQKGDVLFIDEPYAFTTRNPLEFNVDNYCALCMQKTPNCIPCTYCSWYLYCSDECRHCAWNLGHKWECIGSRRNLILNELQKLFLAILFKASYDGFQTTVEDESVYGQENNYPFLDKLLTNKNEQSEIELQKYTQHAVWMVLYLKNYTDYFDWLYSYPNRPEGCKEELYKFVGGQLLKFILQFKCNGVPIVEGTVHFDHKFFGFIKHEPIGYGIFLSTALLNHSCLPNAIQIFHGNKRVIKATESIRKGKEITVNYLIKNFYSNLNTEIRQIKLSKYSFTCTCPGCTDPTKKDFLEPLLCPKCSGRAFQLQNLVFVKCADCHLVFNATAMFNKLNRLRELCIRVEVLADYSVLDEMHKLIKTTVHKYNHIFYIPYNNLCLLHSNEKGEIKKCIEFTKLNMEITEHVMGDIISLSVLITHTFFLAKYCFILKKQNAKTYKKILNETMEMIKKSALMLQYYTCTRNIKQYIADMTKYLSSGYIEMVILDNEDPINIFL